ncbi:MAG: acylphosphatase [Candidatus Thermoplasmatota archaeon]
MLRVRARFYGLVQGVFFRANTRRKAKELGVRGWVRNCTDGSVELLAEGEEQAVKQLLEFCSRHIPYAVIDKVDVNYEEFKNEFKSFEILY